MGPCRTSEEDWGGLQELRGKTLKAGMQIPKEGAPLTWGFRELERRPVNLGDGREAPLGPLRDSVTGSGGA